MTTARVTFTLEAFGVIFFKQAIARLRKIPFNELHVTRSNIHHLVPYGFGFEFYKES